jgi:hypothetical protein
MVVGGLTVGSAAPGAGAGESQHTIRPAAEGTPLFPQCPAIGQDTGCQELITVNSNGSTTAQVDPNQPAFDGNDDILVGVQNNATSSLTSLPLTGTNSFGFDGDGLCTASNAPAGCPFGSTGYEGPNTSFTVTDANDGSVNFGEGLSSGSSAYFSLEAQATAPTTCSSNPCTTRAAVVGTESASLTTTSTTGSISLSLSQTTINCGKADVFLHAPLMSTVSASGTTTTKAKVLIVLFPRTKATGTPGHGYAVCYQSSTPFEDVFGHHVTLGLLPRCETPLDPPCLGSVTARSGGVKEKIFVPAADPRVH